MKRAALLLLCCACAGKQVRRDEAPPSPREAVPEEAPPPLENIDAVLAAARAHLGRTTVRVNGRSFRYDCSGFVRGMFWAAGVDLMGEGGEDDENGVRIVFRYLEKHGQNHFRKVPQKGDLVYFDNTWDMNGNGKLDDPLTHVGIVEEVGADGTLQIIHRSNHGIVREQMNLLRPHDENVNTSLRASGRRDPPGTQHLMGELFAGFGTVASNTR
ncbi:MAG TPA: NlpC/P60 family protein [Myxococcales bacterium]